MAQTYIINGDTLSAIASAIRERLSTDNRYTPPEMPAAIREIVIDDLTDEITSQDNLISEINLSLKNKLSSGSAPEDLSKELNYQDVLIENISKVLERRIVDEEEGATSDLIDEIVRQNLIIETLREVVATRTVNSQEDLSDEIVEQNELLATLGTILNTRLGV